MRDLVWCAVTVLVLVFLVALAGYAVAQGVMRYNANTTCLDHGYPRIREQFPFKFYCVRRLNLSDEVVPVKAFK